MIKICPNCRSTFKLYDRIDISAPALQLIKCPVCTQEIWQPSGWVMPKRWEVGEVVNRYPKEGTPPEPQIFESDMPKEAQKPVWNIQMPDFSAMGKGISKVTNPVGEFFKQSFAPETETTFFGGVKTGAIVVIVVLVIILIFAMSRR